MSDLTLKTFFCADPGSTVYGACDAAKADGAIAAALDSVPAPLRSGLADAVRAALDTVVEAPLGEVLAASWKKLAGVKAALDATRQDPEAVAFVPLLEHRIDSRHKPHVDLMIGSRSLKRLGCDVTLTLNLKGVELEVRQGRLAGLRGGQCSGVGVLALEGLELLRKTSDPFLLPGRVAFSSHESA